MLRELLISSGPVSEEKLQLALQWQYELLHSSNVSHFSDSLNNMPGDAEPSSSEPGYTLCDDTKTELSLPATSPAVSVIGSADEKAPSLVSSHSGSDRARSSLVEISEEKGLQRSAGNQESVRTALNETEVFSVDGQHHREELDQHPVGNLSIQTSPTVQVESLNVIKLKLSAAAPDNSWLSLSVDDLENSYSVIITPKPEPQQTDLQVDEASGHHAAVDPINRSRDQHLHTEFTDPQTKDWKLHPQADVCDPELSLINNILSSSDEFRKESVCSTNPWDFSYHQSSAVDR